MESRAAAWVLRGNEERYHPNCIQYKKRNKGSQLHAWAMVGWNYKGPLVFFDSNNNDESTQFIWDTLRDEDNTPQAVKETLDEEAHLLGDRIPSKCKQQATRLHCRLRGRRCQLTIHDEQKPDNTHKMHKSATSILALVGRLKHRLVNETSRTRGPPDTSAPWPHPVGYSTTSMAGVALNTLSHEQVRVYRV